MIVDPIRTRLTVIVFISFAFLMNSAVALSQDQKSARQKSLDAFNSGQYENAYNGFRQMLVVYPKDPVYKYYTGACLVEMGKDADEAESLLSSALGSGSLRSLPQDALFYLARAQQMNGDFSSAEKSFRRFETEAGKKKAKEYNVPEYITQCRAGLGKAESPKLEADVTPKRIVEEDKPAEKGPVEESPPAPVIKDIPVLKEREYLPPEVDAALGTILTGQNTEKVPAVVDPIKVDSTKNKNSETVIKDATPESKTTNDSVSEKAVKAEEPIKNVTSVATGSAAPKGALSAFEILKKVEEKPIAVNPEIPEGLVYRIQVAVFRNAVSTSYFKGINPIEGFTTSGSTVTTYFGGLFRKAEDARKALALVRNLGFKDSFIAARMDGKAVSTDRAAVLEKQWGSKPLFNIGMPDNPIELDTVPPTLNFRVEVAKTIKPLDKEDTDAMRKAAGNLGLDVRQLENGNIVYLIGNFITFESAEDYAELLRKNGYREARIVAWLGKREIDVATARELFENLQ